MVEWTVRAPMASTIVEVSAAPGQPVRAGQALVVVEAMKMEHELRAGADARVAEVLVRAGDTVDEGDVLVSAVQAARCPEGGDDRASGTRTASNVTRAAAGRPAVAAPMRADLLELQQRLAFTTDAARPDAVARRRANGQRTARENIDDLCDPG